MNLYIHIPFCISKCTYCHFYSVCNQHLMTDYVQALTTELAHYLPRRQAGRTARPSTVYFGGGTPSLLNSTQLEKILTAVNFTPDAEITLEVHPQTLSKQHLNDYHQLGINRLSIGIQSWNPQILQHMGRGYDRQKLVGLIEYAQSLGITNINFDHIISYPNQTDEILIHDLNTSLNLRPTHISIYPLERHPHTRIKRSPNQTKIIRQFALAQNLLTKSGFSHYEELNFCLLHHECRHNLNFWQGQDYLGVGASAVTKIGRQIKTNTSNINTYITDPLNSSQLIHLTSTENDALTEDLKQRLLLYT